MNFFWNILLGTMHLFITSLIKLQKCRNSGRHKNRDAQMHCLAACRPAERNQAICSAAFSDKTPQCLFHRENAHSTRLVSCQVHLPYGQIILFLEVNVNFVKSLIFLVFSKKWQILYGYRSLSYFWRYFLMISVPFPLIHSMCINRWSDKIVREVCKRDNHDQLFPENPYHWVQRFCLILESFRRNREIVR